MRARTTRRSARLLIGALAVGALGATVVTGVTAARQGGQRELDQSARTAADTAAVAIDQSFREARSTILIAARNPAFADFYERATPPAVTAPTPAPSAKGVKTVAPATTTTTTTTTAIPTTATRTVTSTQDDVLSALRSFHDLYPDSVGETCFIDRLGPENARLVNGVAAATADLSKDERQNPFFAPTLTMPVGQVFQARPYLSPDTNDWVISNSTMLVGRSGTSSAMLHFEVSVESFRRLLRNFTTGLPAQIVDGTTGAVVVDSLVPQAKGGALGRPAVGKVTLNAGRRGVDRLGDREVAFRRLDTAAHDQIDWVVVVPIPQASTAVLDAVHPTTLALAAAALALMALIAILSRSDRLRTAATTDTLTGMPNRAAFGHQLERSLERARVEKTELAVLLLDLNRFKNVNDQLGHELGDELLKLVGPRLRHAVRPGDHVARLGSDEFAIVLENIRSAYSAESLARRVAAAVEQPYTIGGVAFAIEVSVGVAMGPAQGGAADELLHRADLARNTAKRRQAGVVMFDEALQSDASDGLEFVSDLRRGIEEGELVVHYQPKIDLATGRAKGVEALVRWQHPTRGFVPPGDFLPLAEETRLIGPLTDYVLLSALKQCRAWLDAGWHLPVAVNISTRVLHDTAFVENVRYALAVTGLAPEMLILEVTETAMMSEPDAARAQLSMLFADGVEVSIDDFGTGYSSLAYLRTLDIDELKIDRAFVSAATTSQSGLVVVRTIVELGHSLGLRVVAEGIEDEPTERALKELGCDIGQGYYWSKPVDPVTMIRGLAERMAARGEPVGEPVEEPAQA